jgi:hypothetical protein
MARHIDFHQPALLDPGHAHNLAAQALGKAGRVRPQHLVPDNPSQIADVGDVEDLLVLGHGRHGQWLRFLLFCLVSHFCFCVRFLIRVAIIGDIRGGVHDTIIVRHKFHGNHG